MTDNILKKHVERTAEELVAEVYPADKTYCGTVKARVKWKPGVFMDECGNKKRVLVWQIERSFETVKQEFSLEKLRVRTFRRLKNVFSLCVVAYLFVTRYLRASSRFKGIVKAIRDNCTEQSLRTHPLLANLRSLIGEERIRNIAGRPRKPPEKEPDQLEFAFPDAA